MHKSASELTGEADGLMQQSRERLAPGLYVRAGEIYLQALSLDPQNTRALLGLAWVRNSQHEFSEGRRWAEMALAVDRDLPEAHALLGDGALELGDYAFAGDCYQRALDLRPDLSSYSRAGQLLWMSGQTEQGIEMMRAAIKVGGASLENSAWCQAQLSMMLFHGGCLKEAGRIVAEALAASPENVHLLNAAGRILLSLNRVDLAIAQLEKSAGIAPTHEALALLTELHEMTGDTEKSRQAFDAVLAFHRDHASLHPRPGTSRLLSGHGSAQLALFLVEHAPARLAEALHEAEAAYRAAPNVFAADALAWTHFFNGDLAQAAEFAEKALRPSPPVADLYFHAGMIHAARGDGAKAQDRLVRALEINPHFHPLRAEQARERIGALLLARENTALSARHIATSSLFASPEECTP